MTLKRLNVSFPHSPANSIPKPIPLFSTNVKKNQLPAILVDSCWIVSVSTQTFNKLVKKQREKYGQEKSS